MSGSTVSRLAQIGATVRILLHLLHGVFYVAVVFPHVRRAERDALISRWSYVGLRLLNIRVHVQGDIPPQNATSILCVANHISWVDILALSAFRRVRFVAKAEVRRWPIIGWLAARTGTLFIQRNRPRQLSRLTRSMNRALKRGDCLAIFPEGTTTDGGRVLPFHSGPLEAAVTSRALVWPVAFRYSAPEGHRSDSVAFVGNRGLVNRCVNGIRRRPPWA
jgi:1-acyl-sn-glycerol-3-phosphate acyltransferase